MQYLYHFPISPFCRKVRLCLAEKGIEIQLIEERYWETRPEFLRMNASAKVPYFKNNEVALSGSQAIVEYIEESQPEPPLMPRALRARAEARRLVDWFDDKFYTEVTEPLISERMMKKITGRGSPTSQRIIQGGKKQKEHLDYMHHLLDMRKWLAGERISLADFAAAGHLSCLDYISDLDWARSDNVKNWYATIKSRPAFRSILADHVQGFRPPPHYADLDF